MRWLLPKGVGRHIILLFWLNITVTAGFMFGYDFLVSLSSRPEWRILLPFIYCAVSLLAYGALITAVIRDARRKLQRQ